MQLERSEFLGMEAYARTKSRRGYRNGFKGKRMQTRVGELRLDIPHLKSKFLSLGRATGLTLSPPTPNVVAGPPATDIEEQVQHRDGVLEWWELLRVLGVATVVHVGNVDI